MEQLMDLLKFDFRIYKTDKVRIPYNKFDKHSTLLLTLTGTICLAGVPNIDHVKMPQVYLIFS